jgi:hypothetical protein
MLEIVAGVYDYGQVLGWQSLGQAIGQLGAAHTAGKRSDVHMGKVVKVDMVKMLDKVVKVDMAK